MGLESGKPFEAQREVREILSSPDRKVALQEWKDAYVEQRTKLAEVQAEIIGRVRKEPGVAKEELRAMFEDAAEKGRFSGEQRKIGDAALDILDERRAIIRAVREKYPDDTELYKAVFGQTPFGSMKVSAGPVALDFYCSNRVDLVRTAYFDQERLVVFQQLIKNVFMGTLGGVAIYKTPRIPELKNMIIARRDVGDRHFGNIAVHEEQHMFRELLLAATERVSEEAEHPTDSPRKALLKECIANIEMKMENELLALMKGDARRVDAFLAQSNYFHRFINVETTSLKQQAAELPVETKDGPSRADLEHVIDVLESREYQSELWNKTMNAHTAYARMRNIGKWPEEKIAALFGLEPLGQWPKLEQRILGKKWQGRKATEKV